MISKTFTVDGAELQQYQQLEGSIVHWSVEHSKAVLQARRLEGALNSMYEGRMQLMNGVMKSQGINPANVHQVHVNADTGEVTVSMNDIPNPAADESENFEVNPTAQAVSPPSSS